MSECQTHAGHSHEHGSQCGHTAVRHNGHTDYLHDGHLHHPHAIGDTVAHYDEHRFEVSATNPEGCVGTTTGCTASGHRHGPGCGHEAVPHGDHVDYLVDGVLHHPDGDHCDTHGAVEVVTT